MLQLFIELFFLATGLYILATGKLPLGFVGGSNYSVESHIARRIGILFVAPLPLFLCLGAVFNMAGAPLEKVGFIEPLVILLMVVSTVLIIRRSRNPVEQVDESVKENV